MDIAEFRQNLQPSTQPVNQFLWFIALQGANADTKINLRVSITYYAVLY